MVNPGLALVFRKASDYPHLFSGWRAEHCAGVEELCIGTYVLVLPNIAEDVHWSAVVVGDEDNRGCYRARFTWVHPHTLKNVDSVDGEIVVSHSEDRGSSSPPWQHEQFFHGRCGLRIVDGTLVFDARWQDKAQHSRTCTGHCMEVCKFTASSPERMGLILRFAQHCRGGVVFCDRGKHRSVSAAKILELLFQRKVSYRFACRHHDYDCCGLPAAVDELALTLRSLPQRLDTRGLSYMLRLPAFRGN